MADSRTIACHDKSSRFTHDVFCHLPSAWDAEVVMTAASEEQSPFFSADEEMSQPVDGVIPAYSGDVEIWCVLAFG